MYQITVICSVKHFTTCYIEGELHMKSILNDAQLLTIMDKRAHAVSKMPNTLKFRFSVPFGRAGFADRRENYRK